jgi:hypothetical protein
MRPHHAADDFVAQTEPLSGFGGAFAAGAALSATCNQHAVPDTPHCTATSVPRGYVLQGVVD